MSKPLKKLLDGRIDKRITFECVICDKKFKLDTARIDLASLINENITELYPEHRAWDPNSIINLT